MLGRDLGAFGVVGATCFVLDLALFQLLYVHVGAGAVTSKLVSTLVTMILAFTGHRLWSFASRGGTGLSGESLRFAVVNGVALGLGLAIVALVRYPLGQDDALVLQAANVGSIIAGTVLRYLAYRHWVFPAAPALPVEGRDGRTAPVQLS
ncbi:MAG: GtrA family protein [Actinomycetes bacterium]